MFNLRKIASDFQKGYDDTKSGGKTLYLTIAVLIIIALHFIQKWTGIPVLDWLETAMEWILKTTLNIIMKFLEWIV